MVDFAIKKQQESGKINNQMLMNINDRDFILSQKYGLMMKKSRTWGRPWRELFFVLTNIGLAYMVNPSDKHVKLF